VILQSNSDADTREIGRRVGKRLVPGNVVCLYGELGSGKTTMVKGIASTFNIDERDITSPSFTIIAEYEADIPFNHIDLYRLSRGEVDGLGLYEYFNSESISIIEWADRAEEEIPEGSIKVRLSHVGEDTREIEIEGISI
jgi:tRNA threonylcarbamoyladenosine biosynthesis protein TsaE